MKKSPDELRLERDLVTKDIIRLTRERTRLERLLKAETQNLARVTAEIDRLVCLEANQQASAGK